MNHFIKKVLIITFVFFSTYVQAVIEEHTQSMSIDVFEGVTTYIDAGPDYNNVIFTPLVKFGPKVTQLFGLATDVRVANQYDLNLLREEDLDGISCVKSFADFGCTEVLDWEYVFTHSSGIEVRGYYDNYKDGNIFMDWDNIIDAQQDQLSTAINFTSGNNAEIFYNVGDPAGIWVAETFLEGISFSQIDICIGNDCSFKKLYADRYVIESDLSSGPLYVAAAIPEPSSIALLALGFLFIGRRRIVKK